MSLEWYILGFYYALCKPAPYKMYSMFYMMNISGLGLNNPFPDDLGQKKLLYALFTIMLLRDSIIYISVLFLLCKDAGQHPDLQGN